MEILMPSPLIYPDYTGGMEIFNYHLARQAAHWGHIVHLATRRWLAGFEAIHVHRLLTRNWRVDTLQILHQIIRRAGAAVAHVAYTSNSTLVYPFNLSRRIGRPMAYTVYIHGGGMRQWRDAAAQRTFFKNAHHVAAVSKPLKREYENRLQRQVEYIPPMIPFTMPAEEKQELRQRFGFSEMDLIFVLVGSVKEIKGSDFTVRTLLSLGREALKRHGLRFVLLGDGPLRAPLENEVAEAGLQAFISFKGLVPHERVGQYLKAADAFLIPSKFEGTPVALLEAMFHGLPVIGSHIDGISEIIEDGENGLLFEPFSAQSMVEKLKLVARDSELRNLLGNAGRERFRTRYSFTRGMERHLSLLQDAACTAHDGIAKQ